VLEDGVPLAGASAGPTGAVVPVKNGNHVYVITGACGDAPVAGCRRPVAPGRSLLQMRNVAVNAKDRLQWKWNAGAATTVADFGDPRTATDYALCAYDGHGALLASASAPAGGDCAGRPCWRATASGFRYVDKALTPNGIRQVVLKAGPAGKAQIGLQGQGATLGLPALPITSLPVTVQLTSSDGACFEAGYSTTLQNLGDRFKAKSD
jgi:hypothetical protein